MQIEYLADHKEFVPLLAQWHHKEWSSLRPEATIEAREDRLLAACGRRQIPTCFIAIEGGELIGSSMLVANDMDNRPELSPWLASVFVRPDRRASGFGSALVRRVVEEAEVLQTGRLYLYTPNKVAFYRRLGWTVHERTEYRGTAVTIMARDIHPDQSNR